MASDVGFLVVSFFVSSRSGPSSSVQKAGRRCFHVSLLVVFSEDFEIFGAFSCSLTHCFVHPAESRDRIPLAF